MKKFFPPIPAQNLPINNRIQRGGIWLPKIPSMEYKKQFAAGCHSSFLPPPAPLPPPPPAAAPHPQQPMASAMHTTPFQEQKAKAKKKKEEEAAAAAAIAAAAKKKEEAAAIAAKKAAAKEAPIATEEGSGSDVSARSQAKKKKAPHRHASEDSKYGPPLGTGEDPDRIRNIRMATCQPIGEPTSGLPPPKRIAPPKKAAPPPAPAPADTNGIGGASVGKRKPPPADVIASDARVDEKITEAAKKLHKKCMINIRDLIDNNKPCPDPLGLKYPKLPSLAVMETMDFYTRGILLLARVVEPLDPATITPEDIVSMAKAICKFNILYHRKNILGLPSRASARREDDEEEEETDAGTIGP